VDGANAICNHIHGKLEPTRSYIFYRFMCKKENIRPNLNNSINQGSRNSPLAKPGFGQRFEFTMALPFPFNTMCDPEENLPGNTGADDWVPGLANESAPGSTPETEKSPESLSDV
jgi:hypothetical protein